MARIAMIGAGSLVFAKTLMMDLLATPGLEDSTLVLMNRTEPKLRRIEAFAKDVVKENNLPATIEATLDRREALAGADFVVNMIQVGGVDAFQWDYEIPLKYGVDQCIGDTIGPGGIFRALRSIPVLMDMAQDMLELCPEATMLNYVNPMSMCCYALGMVEGLKFVGLCHGVQTTLDLIAGYSEVPKEEIDFLCAGTNHMGWFLELHHKGRDLYPDLRAKFELPEYYVNEKVRGEVFRHFGYFMTESTGHLSEYVPWFRKNRKALDLYCDMPDFGGASGAYYKYSRMIADKFAAVDPLARESKQLQPRSAEYCSHIIEAIALDKPFRFNGNVRNDGYITNLPWGSCVEVPVYADRMGLHPLTVGDLPPQCAAMNMSNVQVHGLAVEAALTGNAEMAAQAVAMDPLTSAVCTLYEAREMTREMLKAEAEWLPQFEADALKPLPIISIPADVVPAEVPLDPALAIANRFGELAKD